MIFPQVLQSSPICSYLVPVYDTTQGVALHIVWGLGHRTALQTAFI